jgi:hypothetical protein
MNFSVRNRASSFARLLMRILEFDFRTLGDGRSSIVRYANNSQYRNDSLIRKESMDDPQGDWSHVEHAANFSECVLPP